MEETDGGLEILLKLFTEGYYQGILEKIFHYFDGVDLTALQMAHPTLHHFINVGRLFNLYFSLIISDFQINFWEKERNAAVLRRHWDMWFPRRTRLELGTVISSLVTTQLQIFCGMKNGRIAVYDQNLWPAAVLGGCILELQTGFKRRLS